ncbi:hypothetical protein ABID43_001182 [Methylobacterium goesingense]|uniref:Uncharacterized protein n=2 Tax=Methylobacterium goesingense TaxID=243690 RepID=A0ABV2L2S3_9HYPH
MAMVKSSQHRKTSRRVGIRIIPAQGLTTVTHAGRQAKHPGNPETCSCQATRYEVGTVSPVLAFRDEKGEAKACDGSRQSRMPRLARHDNGADCDEGVESNHGGGHHDVLKPTTIHDLDCIAMAPREPHGTQDGAGPSIAPEQHRRDDSAPEICRT